MPAPSHTHTENIEEIVNEVRFETGAPDLIIEHYTKRAIERFADKSRFWQEDVGPIRVVDASDTYDLAATRYTTIIQLEKIYALNDEGRLQEFVHGPDDGSDTWGYYQPSPFTFTVYPHNQLIGKDLVIDCSLKPREYNDRFRFSTLLTEEYFDALVSGTKAFLYRVSNKPWSNADLAMLNQHEFDNKINDAKTRMTQGFAKEARRIKHVPRLFY